MDRFARRRTVTTAAAAASTKEHFESEKQKARVIDEDRLGRIQIVRLCIDRFGQDNPSGHGANAPKIIDGWIGSDSEHQLPVRAGGIGDLRHPLVLHQSRGTVESVIRAG